MKYISIVNFEEHQHYKDRNIVWIKLYINRILTSYKLRQLSLGECWFYVQLLCLAPAKLNLIPLDRSYLSSTCHIKGLKYLENSIKKMAKLKLIVIINDSKLLSKSYQDDIQKERKKERKNDFLNNSNEEVEKTIKKARETLREKYNLKV